MRSYVIEGITGQGYPKLRSGGPKLQPGEIITVQELGPVEGAARRLLDAVNEGYLVGAQVERIRQAATMLEIALTDTSPDGLGSRP